MDGSLRVVRVGIVEFDGPVVTILHIAIASFLRALPVGPIDKGL